MSKKEVIFLREEYAEGEGTFKYPEGGKYEGQWKNGKKCGWGIETLPCGEKYIGTWKNGKRFNGTKYNKFGGEIGMFENGKWIKGK